MRAPVRRSKASPWLIPLGIVVVLALVGAVIPVGFLALTHWSVAAASGSRTQVALDARVTIARDGRGVAHIRATTDRDLFFGEGYAMAADRLFQMDLTRRFTEGRLAEMLGSPLVDTDRSMRSYAIEAIAARDYAHIDATERAALAAFAAGVNAAAEREPTPPEYRLLQTTFRPWRPQDAIEVSFATLLDLDDDAASIVARDEIHRRLGQRGSDFFLPLTDPRYDVPTNGDPVGRIARLPDAPAAMLGWRRPARQPAALAPGAFDDRPTIGSNGWVVGADRTTVGRAILANDPHLTLGIPAVWWLVEGRSPGYHIAGAVLVGTIGVTLGHNEHVAWGVTAGETAAMRLIREPVRGDDEFYEHERWIHATHDRQTIDVRFGAPVAIDIRRTPNGTVLRTDAREAYLRDWLASRTLEDPFAPFLAVDRSHDVDEAIAAMRALPEPALNLLAADTTGRVAYHLVGGLPRDAAWARWAVAGDAPEPPSVPFAAAPHVDASRTALVVTSNNRPAAGGPRLAPFWPSPYRAYEIRRFLAAAARGEGGKLTPAAVGAAQADDRSPAEQELAALVVAAADRVGAGRDPHLHAAVEELRGFDGRMDAASPAATLVSALRPPMYAALTNGFTDVAAQYIGSSATLTVPLRALRERPRGWVVDWDWFAVNALRSAVAAVGTPTPVFGVWAAQPLTHPLAPFGLSWWNGPTLVGRGGAYAPAVQNRGHGQSFRAEWIAGDWDAGTIDLDAGESGEPGSPHYADQSRAWERFERATLPFSDAAVNAATRATLTLDP